MCFRQRRLTLGACGIGRECVGIELSDSKMGEIMISDVVKGHEAPLHGGTAPFNIMSQFHHKSDILGHRVGGESTKFSGNINSVLFSITPASAPGGF